jgi:TonB family protein
MSHGNGKKREGVSVAVAVSIAVHVALAIGVAVWFDLDDLAPEPPERAEPEAPDKMKVKMVSDPEEERRAEKPAPRVRQPRPKTAEKKPEKKKNEEKKEREKEKLRDLNRKAVVQKTNEEAPEEADYVSEQANKTDEETRARETTDKFVESSQSAKEQEQKEESTEQSEVEEQKLGSKKLAARQRPRRRPPESVKEPPKPPKEAEPADEKSPEEQKEKSPERTTDAKETEAPGPEPAPRESQSDERAKVPRRSDDGEPTEPKKLPMPTIEDYNRIADSSGDARAEREYREKGAGSDMFRRIEESKGSVKAALENYISEVQPGNHTSVNAHADAASGYINRIHHKIHPRWGGGFLPRLDGRYGPSHPLSNPNLRATLELIIDGETGKLDTVNIVESSGQTVYDIEAVSIVQNVAPHPEPPDAIVSPDGKVYIHWNFWRGPRQCGTFGVSIYKVNREGERRKADRPSE